MLTTRFQYKDSDGHTDPVTDVKLMFGAEFVATERGGGPGVTRITDLDGNPLAPDILFDEVICDHCNGLVNSTDPCALAMNRLYCWDCYKEWIAPYLLTDAAPVTR